MTTFTLPTPKIDPLVNLITRYAADTREGKIDLGVGMYRDPRGVTPVMTAVKESENILQQQQQSKGYLGLCGDIEFVNSLAEIIFTNLEASSNSTDAGINSGNKTIVGAQTPGGSGALRIAAETYIAAHPQGTLWIGKPTWPNHFPLMESAQVKTAGFDYFDLQSQTIQFDNMINTLQSATAGDAVLLHGCCHNPTGADMSVNQWAELAALMQDKQLMPIIDLAYHGLGQGLQQDLAATRMLVNQLDNTLIATSCSKNFALYRDRTGAVYMTSSDKTVANRAQAYFAQVARRLYSMPPDHGAAVVKMILQSSELKKIWQFELTEMVERIIRLRQSIADSTEKLGFVAQHRGMFSLLPLTADQVEELITTHGVYVAPDGRINIAGCREDQVDRFVSALSAVGY